MVHCNICGGLTKTLKVKEQMMGLKESFIYHQCQDCGHTQIGSIPENIGQYYNTDNYYSFKKDKGLIKFIIKNIKQSLKKILISFKIKKSIIYSSALESLVSIEGLNKQSNILDYGCGAGQFVTELYELGFKNAKGYDPFLPSALKKISQPILTDDLKELAKTAWDFITLNHVFEHLENPIQTLGSLNNLLAPNGKLLLRFPIIDSFAFEKYKENWVQFDAPRHINLFTRQSIVKAVEQAGNFKILAMYDDSFHFQFTGSELYLKNLSLSPQHNNQIKRLLSFKTYQYHFQAKKLNKQHKGDQMVIILEKI